VTTSIRSDSEVENAIDLFRMAYDRAQNARRAHA
jgi:hypothetical protein